MIIDALKHECQIHVTYCHHQVVFICITILQSINSRRLDLIIQVQQWHWIVVQQSIWSRKWRIRYWGRIANMRDGENRYENSGLAIWTRGLPCWYRSEDIRKFRTQWTRPIPRHFSLSSFSFFGSHTTRTWMPSADLLVGIYHLPMSKKLFFSSTVLYFNVLSRKRERETIEGIAQKSTSSVLLFWNTQQNHCFFCREILL